MCYKFDCDELSHAKAALLLYAMYKSRDKNSPLNGLETWDRFQAFVRGACLKSHTTAGFVQEFCRKAKISSVKPRYLDTGDPIAINDSGEMVLMNGVHDYRLSIIGDDSLLDLYNTESVYLIMLVRERIQREKLEGTYEESED